MYVCMSTLSRLNQRTNLNETWHAKGHVNEHLGHCMGTLFFGKGRPKGQTFFCKVLYLHVNPQACGLWRIVTLTLWQGCQQYSVFPGGHPSKYWLSSTTVWLGWSNGKPVCPVWYGRLPKGQTKRPKKRLQPTMLQWTILNETWHAKASTPETLHGHLIFGKGQAKQPKRPKKVMAQTSGPMLMKLRMQSHLHLGHWMGTSFLAKAKSKDQKGQNVHHPNSVPILSMQRHLRPPQLGEDRDPDMQHLQDISNGKGCCSKQDSSSGMSAPCPTEGS